MTSKKNQRTNYAHRLLNTLERHNKNVQSHPHPVDQGSIIKVGDDDADIIIDLFNSEVNLDGDEVQWMIDEERLRVGDVVTVVFDKAEDPIVVAAVFAADLEAEEDATPDPNSHRHVTEVHVPTGPQATFVAGNRFKHVSVYASGILLAPGIHYTPRAPNVIFNTPALASTIVQLQLHIAE